MEPSTTPLPENGNPAAIRTLPPSRAGAVPRLDPKTSFKGADAMDRLKAYLREVPVLHARLLCVVQGLERLLAEAQTRLAEFDATAALIRTAADKFGKEDGLERTDAGAEAP